MSYQPDHERVAEQMLDGADDNLDCAPAQQTPVLIERVTTTERFAFVSEGECLIPEVEATTPHARRRTIFGGPWGRR